MNPGSVGQSAVDHRRRPIDPESQSCDDPFHGCHQVSHRREGRGNAFQIRSAVDPDLVGAVDQNIGHIRGVQQWLKRAKSENAVYHFADQKLALERSLDGQKPARISGHTGSRCITLPRDQGCHSFDYAHGMSHIGCHACTHRRAPGSFPSSIATTARCPNLGSTGPGTERIPAPEVGCHTDGDG